MPPKPDFAAWPLSEAQALQTEVQNALVEAVGKLSNSADYDGSFLAKLVEKIPEAVIKGFPPLQNRKGKLDVQTSLEVHPQPSEAVSILSEMTDVLQQAVNFHGQTASSSSGQPSKTASTAISVEQNQKAYENWKREDAKAFLEQLRPVQEQVVGTAEGKKVKADLVKELYKKIPATLLGHFPRLRAKMDQVTAEVAKDLVTEILTIFQKMASRALEVTAATDKVDSKAKEETKTGTNAGNKEATEAKAGMSASSNSNKNNSKDAAK